MPNLRILLVVAASVIFVAAGILGGRDSHPDVALLGLLHELAPSSSSFENAVVAITHLGSGFLLIPIALVSAGWLLWRRRHRDALMFLMITMVGRLAVEGLKIVVGRPRPEIDQYPVYVTSLSFPSGHAANSMMTFLALALILPRTSRTRWVAAAVIASIAVGLSRPVLGVHWPSDVVGGWSFGIIWTLLCIASVRRDRTGA